ncbi:MAG: class I SAM-dependent methyltransferase [Rhizobacter sp.]|nr:class I SAM-dependent methyltransferase [Rhizobacter sp.]
MSAVIDRINLLEMRKASSVEHYVSFGGLFPAERAALDRVAGEARGRHILDIGVGAGRTVSALVQLSTDYLGVDISPEMIATCRQRFPGVAFAQADARSLTGVADASVRLVMFSCSGIGMVSHADRLLILREVHRVLEPGGVFLFSTHNQNSPDHAGRFKWPELIFTPNPARLAWRLVRFAKTALLRGYRRARLRKHELRNAEYSLINDECHDYGVMLYYISLANQRRQLEAHGFDADAEAFDGHGVRIDGDTNETTFMLIARKPARR